MQVTYHPSPTPSFSMMGIAATPLVTERDSAGAWEAVHQRVSPGGGSPLHTLATDKMFVVLSGRLVLHVDGTAHDAGPGAVATVPSGVPHRFENAGDAPAELLVVTSGGGHVAFLAGLAELAANGRPAPEVLQAHGAAFDVEFV